MIPQFALADTVIALGEEYQVARFYELGHAVWVFHSYELIPVVPILSRLPCHQDGVEVGIREADDCRGCAGGTGARSAALIYDYNAAAGFR